MRLLTPTRESAMTNLQDPEVGAEERSLSFLLANVNLVIFFSVFCRRITVFTVFLGGLIFRRKKTVKKTLFLLFSPRFH